MQVYYAVVRDVLGAEHILDIPGEHNNQREALECYNYSTGLFNSDGVYVFIPSEKIVSITIMKAS